MSTKIIPTVRIDRKPIHAGKEPGNKLTIEQLNQRLTVRNSNLEIIEELDRDIILCHCKKCNQYLERRRDRITYSYGCPICKGFVVVKGVNDLATTNPEIIKYLANKEDAYRYTRTTKQKIKVKCPDCGYERMISVGTLCRNGYCVCPCNKRNNTVVAGINDIPTLAPWMMEFIKDKDLAYKKSPCSHAKAICVCPICHKEKLMALSNLFMRGFICDYCDAGLSYPNRFLRVFLRELHLDSVDYEYTPDWINPRAYDSHFVYKGIEYIVEMDGKQHFQTTTWSSYEIQHKNDKYKEQMALKHGIKLIRINCSRSEFNYIRNSIYQSELKEIFDLDAIDWDKCRKRCISNLVKEVCEYWKSHADASIKELHEIFGVSTSTVSNYLKAGHEIGIINYSKEVQEHRRLNSSLRTIRKNRGLSGSAYDSENNMIFSYESCCEAEKKLNAYLGTNNHYVVQIGKAMKTNKLYKGLKFVKA